HKKEGANPTVRPRQNVQRSIPTTKSMAPCQLPSGCGIDRLLLALLLVGTTLRLNPSLWRRLFSPRVSLVLPGSRRFLRAYLVFRRNRRLRLDRSAFRSCNLRGNRRRFADSRLTGSRLCGRRLLNSSGLLGCDCCLIGTNGVLGLNNLGACRILRLAPAL